MANYVCMYVCTLRLIFTFFVLLCWYTRLLYISTISAILDCQFFFWQIKRLGRVLVFCSIFYYSEKMDQRNCIKICVKKEIKCARTFEILTVVFGESTISRTQVQLWCNQFKEGQQDVNNRWKHCSSEENDLR